MVVGIILLAVVIYLAFNYVIPKKPKNFPPGNLIFDKLNSLTNSKYASRIAIHVIAHKYLKRIIIHQKFITLSLNSVGKDPQCTQLLGLVQP